MTIASWYFSVSISVAGQEIELHNSEDPKRIYYENSDKYEEWYSYLKRRFREVKEEISCVKL